MSAGRGGSYGGPVIHSLNVYKRLLEITARDVFGGTDGALLAGDVPVKAPYII